MSSFEQYEAACHEYNTSKAIKLAGDEVRYHWVAAKYGLIDVVGHFRKRGHSINWLFLAHVAARWGQRAFVRWAIAQGIGATAWMWMNLAAASGNLMHVRYFIERWGLQPDSTQVIWAGDNGYPEIVKYLYNHLHKRFDHERVEKYYKIALSECDTATQFRDPVKRRETIEWLREYYTNRFVLKAKN